MGNVVAGCRLPRSFGPTAVPRELAAAKKHIYHPGLIESWSGNFSLPFANFDSLNTALNSILLSTLSAIFQRVQSSRQIKMRILKGTYQADDTAVLERRLLHIQEDSKACSCGWPYHAGHWISCYDTNYSKTGKALLNDWMQTCTCGCEWYWRIPKSQRQQGSTCVFCAFAAMLSDLKDPFCNLCVISVPTLQTPRVFSRALPRQTCGPKIPGVSGMWIHLAYSCNTLCFAEPLC